jgi:hypothetical protein
MTQVRRLARDIFFALAISLWWVIVTATPVYADGANGKGFLAGLTSLKAINLHLGINQVDFFGPISSSFKSRTQSVLNGSPISGAILLYKEAGPLSYDTYVPFVWLQLADRTMAPVIVGIDYKNAYQYNNFEFSGTDYWSRTVSKKTIDFYQAKRRSENITLIFIADLDQSKPVRNSDNVECKMSVLVFKRSMINGHIVPSFVPILSYIVSGYSDSDTAMRGEFGFTQGN